MPVSKASCAIHCATATGFSKVNSFSDFIFAELFSSAFFSSWSRSACVILSERSEVSLTTWQFIALVGMIPEWGEGSTGF